MRYHRSPVVASKDREVATLEEGCLGPSNQIAGLDPVASDMDHCSFRGPRRLLLGAQIARAAADVHKSLRSSHKAKALTITSDGRSCARPDVEGSVGISSHQESPSFDFDDKAPGLGGGRLQVGSQLTDASAAQVLTQTDDSGRRDVRCSWRATVPKEDEGESSVENREVLYIHEG